MRYLISQLWREQNTETDVHVFDKANDNRKQRTSWKKYQMTDR